MSTNEDLSVQISFAYANANDPSPVVTIHNARILIPSLRDQIARYGPRYIATRSEKMIGPLKGKREDFEAMILSYGFKVVPPNLKLLDD